MYCKNHGDRDAIGSCTNCGGLVCDSCAVNMGGKIVCKNCVESGATTTTNVTGKKKCDWLITLLLCLFAGGLGAHRFYAGKIGTGLLMLFTAGGCGIWLLVDFIIICCGNFTDIDGNVIER